MYLSRLTKDVKCSISYTSGGKYDISCQVCVSGWYDIVVADFYLVCHVMGRVRVYSGCPHSANCRLAISNSYEPMLGKSHPFTVELFDKFNNRACNIENLEVVASVGKQTLRVPSHLKAHNCIVLFVPNQLGSFYLQVSIGAIPLSSCPVPVFVSIPFEKKLEQLQPYLRTISMGVTPTLPVHRDRLLESAIYVVGDEYFKKRIRICFDDELGIDAGGVARCVSQGVLIQKQNTCFFFHLQGIFSPSLLGTC